MKREVSKPVVCLMKGEEYIKNLREGLKFLGGIENIIPQGVKVLIKPNFTCALPPETGAASDPGIAVEIAKMALKAGASEVIIADGIGAMDVSIYDVKGLEVVSKLKGIRIVDLNEEQTETVPVINPLVVESFKIPRMVLECDVLINLAKLKVHPQAIVSLGMKNLIGVLPGKSYVDHAEAKKQGYKTPVIPGGGKKIFHDLARDVGFTAMQDAIVDLNTIVKSHLCIVDGIYGMEGKGAPVRGNPVKMNLFIMGKDILAVEAVSAAVMGFEPDKFSYLKKAVDRGIGRDYRIKNIDVKGAELGSVRRIFEPANAEYLWKME